MPKLKKGGFLERITTTRDGICETCAHLIVISDTALRCVAHDKLILPEYPPYHGQGIKCGDWRKYGSE
jgi:hypothetical protein